MIDELSNLRHRFGQFLVYLLWAHGAMLAVVSLLVNRSPVGPALAGIFLASAYHLAWRQKGSAPSTRYVSAVALMGQPALLVFLLSGNPWQMDMHMYFFAMLALMIAWCDRRAVLVAAAAIAAHHLLLNLILPMAIFPGGADLARVALHAGIVVLQTAVLVWFSDMLVESFDRIGAMSAEILAKNDVLERTLEAESANRAKSMFLANMSHEIRTPMNAILGFCHLALRTDLTPKQRDYVNKINGAGGSLLRLINDILDFSKNEAGKLDLECQPFDLRASIHHQIQLIAMTAQNKKVAVHVDIDPSVPDMLVGDEMRFGQVVLNLVSNALKFTETGSVSIAVQLLDRKGDAITLSVSVEDTGIGMSVDELGGLFHRFTQADSSTTRRFGGTGLGLAISKQIVELMGGTIRAESEPGKGSKFIFTLAMDVAGAAAAPGVILPPPEISSLRVLIADDNPASREILQEVFTQWSMNVDLVASGHEVLGAAETASRTFRPYDLILLDWKMPGLDGIETTKAIRASKHITKMPVILLVTAYGNDEFRAEAETADIAAFLVKPVDPAILMETIISLFPSGATILNPARENTDAIPMVAPALRGLRVLLVEDNDINREIAVELLTDAGLLVDIAENGKIACARMAQDGAMYSAILMDVQMPEMDGIEATVHIRQNWSSEALPIIAMTAHAYEAERQRCFDAGMNDHIAKPVAPALLIRTLDRWLAPPSSPALGGPAIDQIAIAPSSGDLPDQLPPFDIDAALIRVNGKRPLLRRLIISFGENYGDVVPALQAYIAEHDLAAARRTAHTLKGVAATLEIPEVAGAAAAMETAFAAGKLSGLNEHLLELDRLLTPALAAANSLSRDVPAAPSLAVAAAADPAAAALAAKQLRTALARRSFGARAAYEKLAAAMISPADIHDTEKLQRLRAALYKLDYDAALCALDELILPDENHPIQGIIA